jgi:hypothetical protein
LIWRHLFKVFRLVSDCKFRIDKGHLDVEIRRKDVVVDIEPLNDCSEYSSDEG